MEVLNSIDEVFEYIKGVQLDIVNLSNESLMKMNSYMETNAYEIDEDVSIALQYQDIISQQLYASIEALESVQKSIQNFSDTQRNDESIVLLQEKLAETLQDARDKKSRFSGKCASEYADDEIEFF